MSRGVLGPSAEHTPATAPPADAPRRYVPARSGHPQVVASEHGCRTPIRMRPHDVRRRCASVVLACGSRGAHFGRGLTPASFERCHAEPAGEGGPGHLRAVDGVDLDVAPGETAAVMGPSGCGKSALLNLLGGLGRPSGGEVSLNGRRIDDIGEKALARMRRADVGLAQLARCGRLTLSRAGCEPTGVRAGPDVGGDDTPQRTVEVVAAAPGSFVDPKRPGEDLRPLWPRGACRPDLAGNRPCSRARPRQALDAVIEFRVVRYDEHVDVAVSRVEQRTRPGAPPRSGRSDTASRSLDQGRKL